MLLLWYRKNMQGLHQCELFILGLSQCIIIHHLESEEDSKSNLAETFRSSQEIIQNFDIHQKRHFLFCEEDQDEKEVSSFYRKFYFLGWHKFIL